LLSLVGYLLPYVELNKDFLFYTTILSFIFSGFFYLIKRVVVSSVWIKIIGVYDIEGVKADLRVVIGADTSEGSIKVFDKLRDDVAEFYDLISRKYMKKVALKDKLIKPVTKSRTESLITKIMKVNKDSQMLRDKFINGRVSEPVFKDLMASINHDKEKLETILDLVTT